MGDALDSVLALKAQCDRYREALEEVRAILNPGGLPIWAWNPTRSADALRAIEVALSGRP